jgi:hypothetical protein
MRRGKVRIIRRLAVYCIVFILIGSVLYGLGYGSFRIFKALVGSHPLIEDENKIISVSNEEIVFKKGTEGLFRFETVSKKVDKLTDGNDFAPSWNVEGTGFHFLRKMPDGNLHLFFLDLLNKTVLEKEGVDPITILEIPNIDRDIVKISPDGSKIAVSSYDWGIQYIDLAKRGMNSDIKERDMKAYEKCWDLFDHFSRNSKFFLFTVTNPYEKKFITGITTGKSGSILYLAQTDLTWKLEIDFSEKDRFLGYSFSHNAYSFAYAKGETLYYVDSLKDPKPQAFAVGSFPSIRPIQTKKYSIRKPFWVSFDFTNLSGFLLTEAFGKKFVIAGTPHYLACINLADKKVRIYSEKSLGSPSIYLGWKLIDFLEDDLNNNRDKEFLASWWAGGTSIGAEKIAIFKLTTKGTLTKIFESKNRYKNTLQISDLNGDGSKEVFNLYLDNGGSDNTALEGLYWKDIYSWKDNRFVLDNQNYPNVYSELINKYETFLVNAIKNPDQYGNNLYMIQRLLKQAREIVLPSKK